MNVLRTAKAPARANGPDLDSALTRIAASVGLGVMAAGLLVLGGWAFDIPVLTSPSADLVTMKPNTAAGFVLGGLSLCLSVQWADIRAPPRRAWLARALAVLVGVLGLLTLVEYAVGVDLGIDQVLFADAPGAVGTSTAGRMSPLTAVNFALLAAGMLMLDVNTRAGRRPSNWLALAIVANCYLALLGYFYIARALSGMDGVTAVALPTAILFLVLSIGLVCARPGAHFVRQLGGNGADGVLSRRLLPAALLIPPLLGWMHLQGEQAGYYSTASGLALFAASTAAIFVALIWWHARHLELEGSAHLQAEQSLRDSERRFRATFDNAAIGFALVSLQGRFIAVNQTLCAIVGYPSQALRQLTFQEITHPDDLDTDLALVGRVMAGEIQTYVLEKRYIRKDCSLVWSNLTVSMVRTAAGDPDYFIASVEDISARKSGEAALQSAHATLQERVNERTAELRETNARLLAKGSLVDAVHCAHAQFIAGAPSHAVFKSLLDSLLQLTGSTYGFVGEVDQAPDARTSIAFLAISDVSPGRHARQLQAQLPASPLHFNAGDSLFAAAMTTGKPVIANEAANDPRGAGIPHGHPLLDAFLGLPLHCRGRFVGVIGLANRPGGYSEQIIAAFEPLTQACANLLFAWRADQRRQAADLALARQTAQLEAANKDLEAFSYSVAHDLRTPLRSIDGFSQVLLEDCEAMLDDAGKDSLRRVRAAAQHMGQLIDGSLALSRATSGELVMEQVDLSVLAQSAVAELRQAMPERTVAVSIATGISARGDPRMLGIVMANLVDNAWKFTGNQPAAVIEFNAERAAGELSCHVRDNGNGFDMAEVGNLFGPFQRLSNASKLPGTGIGLATTKRIIARHGGRVWAEGVVGQGSIFSFSLPDAQGPV